MNNAKVKEIFKPVTIDGYENIYSVSNLGRVKSIRRNKFLKLTDTGGYYCVTLCDVKRKTVQVHQLVAETFLRKKSKKGKIVVHHINHNGHDNRLENLMIVSHRKNCSLRKKDNGLPTGVEKRKNRYKAGIVINGKKIYLGSYLSSEDAGIAYQNALRKHLEKIEV